MNLAEVFVAHKRVVVCGGPRAGKSTGCRFSGRWVLSTDAYLLDGTPWDEVPGLAIRDVAALGVSRWALEGCRAPWCLRAGLEADCAVWLAGSLVELEAGQQALAAAARSVWDEWRGGAVGMAVYEL